MATAMTIGWRRGIVAILLIVLTLAGFGRAMASPVDGVRDAAAGLRFPICHAGEAPADPASPASHDCCDACALMASALLPAPPRLGSVSPVRRVVRHADLVVRAPDLARPRDPRLSRGPPSA